MNKAAIIRYLLRPLDWLTICILSATAIAKLLLVLGFKSEVPLPMDEPNYVLPQLPNRLVFLGALVLEALVGYLMWKDAGGRRRYWALAWITATFIWYQAIWRSLDPAANCGCLGVLAPMSRETYDNITAALQMILGGHALLGLVLEKGAVRPAVRVAAGDPSGVADHVYH